MARKALKATLPNDLACVSGWALSWKKNENKRTCALDQIHQNDENKIVAYNYFKSVEQGWSIGQAAEFKVAGVVFWNVSIRSSAQKHFLYVTNKWVSQVLHWIHHHSAINCIPCRKWNTDFIIRFTPVSDVVVRSLINLGYSSVPQSQQLWCPFRHFEDPSKRKKVPVIIINNVMNSALERQKGGHEDGSWSPDWIEFFFPFDQLNSCITHMYLFIYLFLLSKMYSSICPYPLRMQCRSPVQIPSSHPRARASF